MGYKFLFLVLRFCGSLDLMPWLFGKMLAVLLSFLVPRYGCGIY